MKPYRKNVLDRLSRMREVNLSVAGLVGLLMAAEDGGAPLGAVVKAARMSSPSGTQLADRLERQGLVTRVQGEDRRSWRIEATRHGRAVLRDLLGPAG